ncbi:hypothetical protein [Chroococcidiopsis sp. SAG 2025]|nr:hypothetical protein [Chroococcidiopsis sp. SAG 2025]
MSEQTAIEQLWWRYLYQRSLGQLLEGTVTLLLAAKLHELRVHGSFW